MSHLAIYDEEGNLLELLKEYQDVSKALSGLGVRFERWNTKPISLEAGQEEVIDVYKDDIDRINNEFGFKSMDVVSLNPNHPKKDEFRSMFLNEHTHSDFEVRFFVDGSGTFYIHIDDKVYVVFCEKGDFISVPADTKHWFDMGQKPFFKAIRFFLIPDGWVGHFTGSSISLKIPSHDDIATL